LTFSDDPALLPMECFVFNTEAHPLPVVRDGVSDGRACVERVVEGHVETLAETLGV
jgi:mannosyl-oligosaccharide alpha-1,2-mannosidase